jgi:hypothetical protein
MFNWIESHGKTALLTAVLASVIIGTSILAGGLVKFKALEQSKLAVTGYAETLVQSDIAEWTLTVSAFDSSKAQAYKKLNHDLATLKNVLNTNGIPPSDLNENTLYVTPNYTKNLNGYDTTVLAGYTLSKAVVVHTTKLDAVQSTAKTLERLVGNGLGVDVTAPQYLFSKLDSLKLNLIAKATKNAKDRATTMAKVTGNEVGSLLSATSGVFQITPPNSTDVSDYGQYDTTTRQKKVTSVVNVTFSIQ